MKAATTAVAVFFGAIVLYVLIGLFGIAFNLFTLPLLKFESKVKLNQEVIKKTYNVDYCLNNYEWFKDTYQDIQQSDAKIASVQAQLDQFKADAGERSGWTFEDKQNYNNITAEITGIKNYKADLVGQYNSRSEQLNRVACKELPLYVQI